MIADAMMAAVTGPKALARRALRRLGQPVGGRDQFESRLVWIFGSPRSGSTWLLGLLVHPLVPSAGWSDGDLAPEQPPGARSPRAIPINEPYIPQHLTPPLFQDQAVSGDFIAVTLNSFRHAQADYFLSDHYAEVWRPRLRELVLARLEAQARRVAATHSLRHPLVMVKEPNGSLGADFLMSLLPRARLIFLLRDGRDVVDSMIDAQSPGGWLERTWDPLDDSAERRLELVRRESVLWVARTRAVQGAYAAHAPALRCLVRYEDLLDDPLTNLIELDRWLGLGRGAAILQEAVRSNAFGSFPDEVKGPGRQLRAAQPGLWRSNRTASEKRVMEEVMGETLRELGYV